MTERPILFSGAMVKALLDGTKTQTRRVVKPQPRHVDVGVPYGAPDPFGMGKGGTPIRCPYGHPGDHLWVREAWARTTVFPGSEIVVYRESDNRTDYGGPWKPSIHMHRASSRITLEVTGVRVERLQSISRGDAMAEGCPFQNMAAGPDPRKWYAELWDAINGPGAWASNSWAWVVEFRRV